MSLTDKDMADRLVDAVGGSDNIASADHCMTRLRLSLKDQSLANKEKIESIEGVRGVVFVGGLTQVIIGDRVPQLLDSMRADGVIVVGDIEANGAPGAVASKQRVSLWAAILDYIVGSITPAIPVILTGGLVLSILALLKAVGAVQAGSGVEILLSGIGNAPLFFLPIFIGYTAARKLGTNEFVGMLLAMVMLLPALAEVIASEEGLIVFGLRVPNAIYSGTIIPILLAVWVMKYVYRFFSNLLPKSLKYLFTPTLTILVMAPVVLYLVGPLGYYIGVGIGTGLVALMDMGLGWLVIFLVALGFPFMMMTGMHNAVIFPIIANGLQVVGYDAIIVPAALAWGSALIGTALAVGIKTKNPILKSEGLTTALTTTLGVGEPALYSIALRLRRPFIGMLIGSAIGAVFVAIFQLKTFVFAISMIFALPGFITPPEFMDIAPNNFVYAIITYVISLVAGFVATWVIGFEEPQNVEGGFAAGGDAN